MGLFWSFLTIPPPPPSMAGTPFWQNEPKKGQQYQRFTQVTRRLRICASHIRKAIKAGTDDKATFPRKHRRWAPDQRCGGGLCSCVAASDIGDRAACAAILRHRPREAGPRSRGHRQLQRLPYLARWQSVCRRPACADALRHDLFVKYHAGRGHRHRPLVGGRLPTRDAVRD